MLENPIKPESKEAKKESIVIEKGYMEFDETSGECHCKICAGDTFRIVKEGDTIHTVCKDCGN